MFYPYFDPVNTIFHVLIWVLVVSFIVWIIRGSRHNHHIRMRDMHDMWGNHNKALDLLKERYAKGEINKEEFEEKRRVLTE